MFLFHFSHTTSPIPVVTGASEGIGRGYTLEVSITSLCCCSSIDLSVLLYFQLARQGLNVVIMSRSQDKLQKVANEISELIGSGYALVCKAIAPPLSTPVHPCPLLSTPVHSCPPPNSPTEEKYSCEVWIIPVDLSGSHSLRSTQR